MTNVIPLDPLRRGIIPVYHGRSRHEIATEAQVYARIWWRMADAGPRRVFIVHRETAAQLYAVARQAMGIIEEDYRHG